MKICWAQTLFILIVIILGISNILSACGQKGPLYLPDEQQQPEKHKKQ